MIKGIIFDCFGVLTTDGWLPFKVQHFGSDDKLLEEATELNKQSDAGLLGYEQFVDSIARLAGVTGAVVHHAIESNVANEPLIEYIEHDLKPNYKLGMLSNVASNWLNAMFGPERLRLFDAMALSYETGYIKPDPRAYNAIAERLGLQAQECVFIDDQERNCTGAQEAGMQAIWYKDLEQLKRDLQLILGDAKN